MTIDDVKARLAAFSVDDNECAHIGQDQLYEDALEAIANGACDDPAALAREVLAVRKLNFNRWYA